LTIGSKISAITTKNRYYPPFNEATIDINYNDGINQYAGMLELAIKAGVVTQAGAWYTFDDGTKCQGSINALQHINGNKNMLDSLDAWLKSTGYSTINRNVAEAMGVVENIDIDELKDEPNNVKSILKPRKNGKKK